MSKLRVALAMTGSFCTFERALEAFESLSQFDLIPIMSENAATTDTRFGLAADFERRFSALCGKRVLRTIAETEPIGPKGMADVLVIAPCTGNTLAKLACGVTDTCVLMAAKSQLRSGGAVLLAPSTNDGLSASARNIGLLLTRKNVFFVPFYQDDPANKPTSLVTDYSKLLESTISASRHEQLQPVLEVK